MDCSSSNSNSSASACFVVARARDFPDVEAAESETSANWSEHPSAVTCHAR